jgi:hypothetical protein
VLISLLAMFVVALSAGIRATFADVPVVLEGPSTLELGLIGGGIIIIYAVTTRIVGRRRARIASANIAGPMAAATEQSAAVEAGAQQEQSRGAA